MSSDIRQNIAIKAKLKSKSSETYELIVLYMLTIWLQLEPKVDLKCFSGKTIRNFCVIAHIDHGKSTLSDRMLELTQTIPKEQHIKQYLDKLQVERERGITVKAQTCSMLWTRDGSQYLLNLIDTPVKWP